MAEREIYLAEFKQGYLHKRSSSFLKTWDKRWVILKGFCLLIYLEKPGETNTNDAIDILDVSVYDRIEPCPRTQQSNATIFDLCSSNSDIAPRVTFKCHSVEELSEWTTSIQRQQHKLILNDKINDDHDEVEVFSSISQLIDDGYTLDETELALKNSFVDNNEESDSDSDDAEASDPRSMFENDLRCNRQHLTSETHAAIQRHLEDEKCELESMTAKMNIDYKQLRMNYTQLARAVQDLLHIDIESMGHTDTTAHNGATDAQKSKLVVLSGKVLESQKFEFEMKSIAKPNQKRKEIVQNETSEVEWKSKE